MKFVTKKAKLIILGIIFIGAVLLAYNSLHNNLAYLDLKDHLGGSPFEGFENSSGNEDDYDRRHSSDYPKNTKKDSQDEDCDKYSNDKYSNDKKDKKDKKDDSSYKNSSSYDKFSSTMSSYANSATSTVDDIINDFDGSSSRDKDYKVNNGSGLDSKKKKKSCDESSKRDRRRDDGHDDDRYKHDRYKHDRYNDDRYSDDRYSGGGGGYGGYSSGRSGYEYSGDNGAGYNAARYNGSGSNSNQNNSTKNKDKAKSQIPAGSEDLYILKSEIVPPVCPVCPSVTACPNEPVPPCPPCGRCPESSFECKKVPNYGNNQSSFMPMPVLNDFSTFGM